MIRLINNMRPTSAGRNTPYVLTATVLALALLLAAAACSDDADSEKAQTTAAGSAATQASSPKTDKTSGAPSVSVVTTTNIMADWVENIGGGNMDVFSLLPAGTDPHTFQPGAQDVAKVADADLVLSVGLGLEASWLHDLLENAARDESTIVELGEIVDPIEFAQGHAGEVEMLEDLSHIVHEVEEGEIDPETGLQEIKELLEAAEEEELPAMLLEIVAKVDDGQMDAQDAIEEIEHLTGEGEDEHAGHGHGLEDPHFWFDPLRVKLAVNDIAARLSVLDPDRGDTYSANASAYNARLDELHAWSEQQAATVPEDRRLLVTSHDSFGYFANLYGFEVVGVVLSGTTDVEPSAGDLAELVEEVKEYGVPALFGETTVSERMASTVASESGAELVRLYSGSIGLEGSGAETYIEMIRTNVGRIVEALK
jgi:zinc/manganese transport system substrate-binding protein